VIGGANTAQQCLRAGLVDEIHIGIVPVLFGEGLRFFEPLVNEQMELERFLANRKRAWNGVNERNGLQGRRRGARRPEPEGAHDQQNAEDDRVDAEKPDQA
jgi:RibD domain-containing protein